jgi:hypothetical protein
VSLRSNGRQNVSGATFDITLHSAGQLKSATIHHGAACTLQTETRARCALPNLARNAQLYIDYTAEFAEPGNYDVTFTAAAAGDSAPANDSLVRAVLVRPYYDASVSGSLRMDDLFGGQTRVQTFTVNTDRRGLASARFRAAHAAPALQVDAISATAGDCHVDTDLGGICDFTNLPANAGESVSVTYRVADGSWTVDPVVSITTAGDVVSSNNSLTARVETFGSTDLELRVATTMAGPKSTELSFPAIEMVNGGNKAIAPRLEVTLPPQVTVVDVSAADAVCTGTTVLTCEFDTLEPFARASVNLSVRASADGSFTSNVRVTSANDNNTTNDTREVAVEIASVSVTPVSGGSGGGGGGGRMEWLALAFLALLIGVRPRLLAKTARATRELKKRR